MIRAALSRLLSIVGLATAHDRDQWREAAIILRRSYAEHLRLSELQYQTMLAEIVRLGGARWPATVDGKERAKWSEN
jgi:hypothetical protein